MIILMEKIILNALKGMMEDRMNDKALTPEELEKERHEDFLELGEVEDNDCNCITCKTIRNIDIEIGNLDEADDLQEQIRLIKKDGFTREEIARRIIDSEKRMRSAVNDFHIDKIIKNLYIISKEIEENKEEK